MLVMRAALMQSAGQWPEFTKLTKTEGNRRGMAPQLPVLSPVLSKYHKESVFKRSGVLYVTSCERASNDGQMILFVFIHFW